MRRERAALRAAGLPQGPSGAGLQAEETGRLLGQFVAYCEQSGTTTVTTDVAVAWATLPATAHASWWGQRLSKVRCFATWLQTLDPATEVPPPDILTGRPRRAVPYLYTDAEVCAIMAAARSLRSPLQQRTYHALVGLLAVTGCRVGEVIRLEQDRGLSVASRNTRLAAVHSLFRFAALRHPEHAALIQRVLAIPTKRAERAIVCFLTPPEVDALLASPDRSRSTGRRDHALLVVAVQTGLRVSELVGLRRRDIQLGAGAHVRCRGKGRKDRSTPLTRQTVSIVRAYLAERGGTPDDPIFPGPRGAPLSRDAVRRLVERHTATAAQSCHSLTSKKTSPHVLRHTAAMRLLESGCDLATISLWLGHENPRTSQIYLHAHLALRERALARTAPPHTKPGRYQPPDRILAFLDQL